VRILVATDQWFPDTFGGVARVATASAQELATRGHHVEVLAPRRGRRGEVSCEAGVVLHRVLPRNALPKTVTDAIATYAAARRRRGEFDVLLAHAVTTACGLLAAKLDAPLVLAFHSSDLLEIRFRRERSGLGYRLRSYALEPLVGHMEKAAIREARRVVVLSRFTRGLLLRRDPRAAGRAVVIGAGVDLVRFSPRDRGEARRRLGLADDGRPLLVTVRRLELRMGLEELLRAVAELVRAQPVRLAVIGDGSLRPQLERVARRLKLTDSVSFLGRVADDELPDWYRAADLFVLPTVAYEGFGLVTAEALASGTPVVGTAIGATPELLEPLDERLLVAEATPAALADGIRSGLAIADAELREACRVYACSRFSWEQAVARLEDALSAAARTGRLEPERAPAVYATGELRSGTRALAKELVYLAVRASGLAWLVRTLVGRRRVAILVYHHPRPETFERHLRYLRKVANLISLDELVDALALRDFSRLPPRSVVLTIDDGHRSNRELLDVLARHGVVPTIFLCSQIVATRRGFWWTPLNLPERRRLMRLDDRGRLRELAERYGLSPEDERATPEALSADEVGDLRRCVDFEAHTRFHAVLPRCGESEAALEIAGSKQELETLLGRPCRHFAYPYGAYGPRERRLVREAGFASARTTDIGWNGVDADPFRLKVLGIDDAASVTALAAHLAGIQLVWCLLRGIAARWRTRRANDRAVGADEDAPAGEPVEVLPREGSLP
jgi:glycosyltransferase involved in cell wall biosynthesis/peptidoglycan/xylan/chitin deacetylase (PgdA/CDA1 family)